MNIVIALAAAAVASGPPGPGTAPFAASCKVAAQNMQGRVRPETPDFKQIGAVVERWDKELISLEPEAGQRRRLEEGITAELNAGLAKAPGYMEGMMMVSQHMTVCAQASAATS